MQKFEKTKCPCFSCGPCKKRTGWNYEIFKNSKTIGRSHRCDISKKLIKEVIDLQKELLNLPKDYILGIMPASDTGAFELAMWNLVGKIGVDVISFEAFSKNWADDIIKTLKIKDTRHFNSDYGSIPKIEGVDGDRDIILTYNGTTSGVCFENLDFIKNERQGLVFCDATSIAFAKKIDFNKIDILTYSWQKILGGEAGFGMLALGPRAIKRLEEYEPENRPLPKIFKIKKNGKCDLEIFEGVTINTISMLCIEDIKDTLLWAKNNGGSEFLINKVNDNSQYLYNFIDNNEYLERLCKNKKISSPTSVCFTIKDSLFKNIEEKEQIIKKIINIFNLEEIAFDIGSYKTAPIGFRVWCGPTVELEDIKILCKNLEYISLTFTLNIKSSH